MARLTESGLATTLFSAILPRMNGFRVTILTLLCLSVALMFYVVLYVIPSWQEEYNTYRSDMRITKYDKKNDLHRQQMQALDPTAESPEEEAARLAEEEAARLNEQSLQEAEESIIVAAAKRREEAALAQARAEEEAKAAEAAKAAQPRAVGIVASYDEAWSCIMVKPAVMGVFAQGTVLAVRRDGKILCEAVVDGVDVESGQVSATVRMEEQLDPSVPVAPQAAPAVGDEVIVSPFASGDDLRNAGERTTGYDTLPAEPLTPAPAEEAVPASTVIPEPVAPAGDANNTSTQEPALRSNSTLPSLDAMLLHP